MTTICQAEVRAIFVAKTVRTFCYGFLGIALPVYLSELGLTAAGLGVAVTLTLAGSALLTWLLPPPAERDRGGPPPRRPPPPAAPPPPRPLLPRAPPPLSRRLAALGALDAFAGGFVLQSLVVYFLHERYALGLEALGGVFFATQVLTAASLLLAVRAAARFGLLATMVVSHLVSNVVLILIAWAPTAAVAIALLCLRHLLSQMDVPTRQAYVMALVEDHEREAAATTTNIARTVAQAVTPALAEAREARNRLRPAVLDERRPPLEPCQRQHLGDARLGLDEPLHLVGGEEELVNGRAPPVTALGATHAALAPVEDERLVVRVAELRERVLPVRLRELVELGAVRTVFGPALPAEPLHEPLGEDAQEGVGEVEGIEPHVEETNDRLHGAVRVERAEHEVAGERRLDAGRGRLLVTHLTDHDDVRVRAQEGAHGLGEREADLRVDLHLAQAVLRDLDRILRGPDLALGLVDVPEDRVERRRLARSRRPHAQDEAVGLLGDLPELGEVPLRHPELVHGDRLARGEDAHDHVFVRVLRRDGGDAELDLPAVRHLEPDLAVLRLAPLGDVELRHDLDARDDRAAEGAGDLLVLGAAAVDAVPDHRILLRAVGLDVDVRGARLVGLHDELVGEPDDGAVVLVDLARGDLAQGRLPLARRLLGLELAEDAADHARRARLTVRGVEVGEDVLPEAHRPLDLSVLQGLAHAVHALQVLRIVV